MLRRHKERERTEGVTWCWRCMTWVSPVRLPIAQAMRTNEVTIAVKRWLGCRRTLTTDTRDGRRWMRVERGCVARIRPSLCRYDRRKVGTCI